MKLKDLKPQIKDVPLYGPGQRWILGQRGYDPTGIVLHTPAGHVWSNIGLKWWYDSGKALGITHYAADMATGRVFQHVSPPWMVAANSHGDANRNLLSIEVDDQGNPNDSKRTPAVYESTGRLVAYLAVLYNWVEEGGRVEYKKHVHLHRDFTDQKPCPGALDYKQIIRIANRWLEKYWEAQNQELKEKTPPQKPVKSDSDTKGGQSVEPGQESQVQEPQGDSGQVNDDLDINDQDMANLEGGNPQVSEAQRQIVEAASEDAAKTIVDWIADRLGGVPKSIKAFIWVGLSILATLALNEATMALGAGEVSAWAIPFVNMFLVLIEDLRTTILDRARQK